MFGLFLWENCTKAIFSTLKTKWINYVKFPHTSFNDRNVVLFGHSNLDRSMFGSLNDVFKEGFFDTPNADIIYIFDTISCGLVN